jgi:DMSO/TMAO reductase YedYZ molybdopterin-dependent catalytic subunit
MTLSLQRRRLITGTGAALLTPALARAESTRLPEELPDGTRQIAAFVNLPDKRRLLRLSDRPPNYASPIDVFTNPVTPIDRFYVRYHMDSVPSVEAMDRWTLRVGGDAVAKPVTLKLSDMLDLPQSEVLAVCQCAGNRRGLAIPHVAGVQWPDGAMGCATWHGPALRDVLKTAGVASGAIEVWLQGADLPPYPGMPAYRKSIPMDKALDANTIVAVAMNGAPLPQLNGYPARLVVPGWTSTYWMKHLTSIEVSTAPLSSFWMKTAYRVPAGLFPVQLPFASQVTETTVPVTEIVVNSLIADPLEGNEVERYGFTISGIAWDRGNGINRVEVSLDGGVNWQDALLDRPLGPYAYRQFSLQPGMMRPGTYRLVSRATSNSGERQATAMKLNPGGYHNNVPRPIAVAVR